MTEDTEQRIEVDILEEYMRNVEEQSKLFLRDIKAMTPMIGVWWYDGKTVFGDFAPVREGVDHGPFVVLTTSHLRLWSGYQRLNPMLHQQDYTDIPRGRTIYDKTTNQFIVYAARETIEDMSFQDIILRDLNLPRVNTLFKVDNHYE